MNALRDPATPVDLAATHSDDTLLTMLASNVVITDDELTRALYAWRREVDSEPFGDLVDVDAAVRVIRDVVAWERLWSWLRIAAAAVAVMVIVLAAASLVLTAGGLR